MDYNALTALVRLELLACTDSLISAERASFYSGPDDSSSDDKEDLLDEQADVIAASSDNAQPSDPLDREDFESDTFVHELISKSTVKELVAIDNTITLEIRTLDNDLQMLVYENYAKFIAATDIIKEMQLKVGNLHSDMAKLKSTVDTLGNYYTSAEEVIDPSRSKIERLLGLSRLVGRLNFLFDLPDRLRSEISKQNYARAVAMFTSSIKILEQYSLIKSFQEIRKEAEQILKDLKIKLRLKLQSYENAKGVELISIATLLLKLDEEPSLLWHDILSSKRDWFLINLEKAKRTSSSDAHLLKNLRMCFADEFIEFASEFKNLFLPAIPGVSDQNSQSPRTVQADAVVALNSFSRQVFTMYLEDARSTLMKIVENLSSNCLNRDEHQCHLEVLVNEVKSLQDVVCAADKAVQNSQLAARSKELSDSVVKRVIMSVFSQCHRRILQSVVGYVCEPSSTIPALDKCINQIHEHLKSASLDGSLVCSYHPQSDKLIQDLFLEALGNVQAMLLGDNGVIGLESAIQISANKFEIRKSLATAVKTVSRLILLRLSKLCAPCQGFVLPEIFEFLAGLFPSFSASPAFNKRCANLVQLFKETEKTLLNAAARQAGTDMSLLLVGGVVSSLTSFPTRPSHCIFSWRRVAVDFQRQLAAVISQVAELPVKYISHSRPMRRNDIHRMFAQTHTTPVFVLVEPSFESLLHASLKIAFKAWIECVRVNTFSALQFQQIQIDVFVARMSIPSSLNPNRSILDSLLDEVITSAMDTCRDSSPELSPDLVDRYSSVSE